MKKIPTVFEREYENHKVVGIKPVYTSNETFEAFKHGVATVKYDGSCCAIIDGQFYKRFDAKKGRKIPEGAIPCCDPDPVTGHHPHWVKVTNDPADKWFREAYFNSMPRVDGTYEAIGPHFQGNPYALVADTLVPHGFEKVSLPERSFEAVREYLKDDYIEGIVFWLHGEPKCKIKRSDFGFEWNVNIKENGK